MYVSRPIPDDKKEHTVTSRQGNEFKVKIRLVKEVNPTDPMYITFYNNVLKNCQHLLDLDEMGRNFSDRHQAKPYPNFKNSLAGLCDCDAST